MGEEEEPTPKDQFKFVMLEGDAYTKIISYDKRYENTSKNFIVKASEVYEQMLESKAIDPGMKIMLRP